MKPVLTIAATVTALALTAVSPAAAGALPSLPENIVFPTDFDGYSADKAKKTVKVAE